MHVVLGPEQQIGVNDHVGRLRPSSIAGIDCAVHLNRRNANGGSGDRIRPYIPINAAAAGSRDRGPGQNRKMGRFAQVDGIRTRGHHHRLRGHHGHCKHQAQEHMRSPLN
jgi:hypothetical protein